MVASGGLVEYSNGEWSAHTELDNVSAVGGGGPGQHVWAKIWDAVHDIARYDGDGWCAYKMSNYGVTDIWVLADDDIWTLGNTTIGHWDGVKWTHKYDYEGGRDLWGTSDEDMWFVGSGAAHWNGSEIEPYPAAPLIYSIYGNAADNVWLKTSSSLMRYIGGDSWLQYPTSEFSGGDVWIDQETGKGWAVGGSLGKARLYEGDGDDWTLSDYAPDSKTLAGVHGSGLDNVWAFGETLLQYDGQTWKDWELGTKLYEYDSIYAVSATEAWASSLNRVRHFTNGDLQPSEVIEGIPGKAIHGSSGADIWSVGSLGKIAHYNGDSWSIVNSPTSNHLYAVWAHTPSVAWAGGKSHLLRWDGQSWSIVYTTPNAETIFAIWGTAADDVWAVGGPDLILHWDGLTWKKIMLIDGPWGFTLRDVWGLEADDMYAVGYRGAAGVYYRFDGAVWKQLDSSLDRSFNAIRRSPKGELWVGGTYKDPREYGLLYRNEDLDGWQPEDEMLLLDPSRSWIEHMSNSPDGTTTWLVSDRNVYVYQ
ncbi:MAG: hypothetical protein KC636_25970 [Myxococcales bacterium]|nr:hypothetical protein [Myxococcales bacterium]